jgi:hypothetical protein
MHEFPCLINIQSPRHTLCIIKPDQGAVNKKNYKSTKNEEPPFLHVSGEQFMDPLTLFALANGAVSAVKAGCKLYKDIKAAAGDVRDVLKDLDEQFAKRHPPNKPPTVAEKNQYVAEKNRVIELNKKSGDTTSIYQEIGEHLGTYYDNLHKCMAVFEEEEKRSKTEIYDGTDSLGKRALQRVLMKKQLEQMSVELREIMVYQCPPELGALYTEVEEMMKVLGKQQKGVIAAHIQQEKILARRRAIAREKAKKKCLTAGGVLIIIVCYAAMMLWVIETRKQDYPELGQGLFPDPVSNYDEIVAARNRKYWEERERDVKNRLEQATP